MVVEGFRVLVEELITIWKVTKLRDAGRDWLGISRVVMGQKMFDQAFSDSVSMGLDKEMVGGEIKYVGEDE